MRGERPISRHPRVAVARSACSARGGQRAFVNILAVPQLEDQQLPEAQRMISTAAQMFMDESVDESGLEVAALAGTRRSQDIGEHIGQSTAKPDAKRHPKSLFLSIENLCRQ